MLDLSQTDLANALGVSFQQIQKYEKGTNRVSASRLQQIASFLQVPIPYFFDGLPLPPGKPKSGADAPSPQDVSNFAATPDGHALIKAFLQIKEPKRQLRIIRLMEKMSGKRD